MSRETGIRTLDKSINSDREVLTVVPTPNPDRTRADHSRDYEVAGVHPIPQPTEDIVVNTPKVPNVVKHAGDEPTPDVSKKAVRPDPKLKAIRVEKLLQEIPDVVDETKLNDEEGIDLVRYQRESLKDMTDETQPGPDATGEVELDVKERELNEKAKRQMDTRFPKLPQNSNDEDEENDDQTYLGYLPGQKPFKIP